MVHTNTNPNTNNEGDSFSLYWKNATQAIRVDLLSCASPLLSLSTDLRPEGDTFGKCDVRRVDAQKVLAPEMNLEEL